MKKLRITRILEYYDVPQLFVAEDVIGLRYLCLLYDIADDGELQIIGVAVSAVRLNDFLRGRTDLLGMFTSAEVKDSVFNIYMKEGGVYAEPFIGALNPSMLPEVGCYYDESLL